MIADITLQINYTFDLTVFGRSESLTWSAKSFSRFIASTLRLGNGNLRGNVIFSVVSSKNQLNNKKEFILTQCHYIVLSCYIIFSPRIINLGRNYQSLTIQNTRFPTVPDNTETSLCPIGPPCLPLLLSSALPLCHWNKSRKKELRTLRFVTKSWKTLDSVIFKHLLVKKWLILKMNSYAKFWYM